MFREIVELFLKMKVCEQRSIGEGYCELVFYNKDITGWKTVLNDIFGQAVKPEGAKASKEHNSLTEKYGGVFENQVLFKKDFDSFTGILMLWPWQDGLHTTLKMAVVNE